MSENKIPLATFLLQKGSRQQKLQVINDLQQESSEESINALIEALIDDDLTVQLQANEALIKIGEKTIPIIKKVFSINNWKLRNRLTSVLCAIIAKSPDRTSQLKAQTTHIKQLLLEKTAQNKGKISDLEIKDIIFNNVEPFINTSRPKPVINVMAYLRSFLLLGGGRLTLSIPNMPTITLENVPFLKRAEHKIDDILVGSGISHKDDNIRNKARHTIFPLPTIVMFWPLLLATILCGILKTFAFSIAAPIFLFVFAINISIIAFDILTVKTLAIIVSTICLSLIPPISTTIATALAQVDVSATLYFSIAVILFFAIVAGICANYLWNRWTIGFGRLIHRHGLLGDIREFPVIDLNVIPSFDKAPAAIMAAPMAAGAAAEYGEPAVSHKLSRIETPPITLEIDKPVKERDEEAEQIAKYAIEHVKPEEFPQASGFNEQLLSEDAGNPGSIERIIAQSTWAMKTIQATIGLHFLLIANVCDLIVNTISSYINKIYYTWKMSKSIHRQMSRHTADEHSQALTLELTQCRLQISHLFAFSGFDIERFYHDEWQDYTNATFPLQLVVEIRGQLDEMKRDLNFLTEAQIGEFVKKKFLDFLKSFIPNPMDFSSGLKDLFVLSVLMKYSREEIEMMYADFILSYRQLIFLARNTKEGELITFENYEDQLIERSQWAKKPIDIEAMDLEQIIARCRRSAQRLLQMLCKPGPFIDPCCWSREDLLGETYKWQSINKTHLLYEFEIERWLTKEIKRGLRHKHFKPDNKEKKLQLIEAKNFRRRYLRLQQLRYTFPAIVSHYGQYITDPAEVYLVWQGEVATSAEIIAARKLDKNLQNMRISEVRDTLRSVKEWPIGHYSLDEIPDLEKRAKELDIKLLYRGINQ